MPIATIATMATGRLPSAVPASSTISSSVAVMTAPTDRSSPRTITTRS
jgi:hypothetical protein